MNQLLYHSLSSLRCSSRTRILLALSSRESSYLYAPGPGTFKAGLIGQICLPNLSVFPSKNMLLLLTAEASLCDIYASGLGSCLSSRSSITFSSFMVGMVTLSFLFFSTDFFSSVTAYVPGPTLILLSSSLSKLRHLSSLSNTADLLAIFFLASLSCRLFSSSIFSIWSSYSDSSVLKKQLSMILDLSLLLSIFSQGYFLSYSSRVSLMLLPKEQPLCRLKSLSTLGRQCLYCSSYLISRFFLLSGTTIRQSSLPLQNPLD